MKIAVLSDIHANIFALEAVYKDLEKEAIDYILVAGDLIGYYYWPKEVVSMLRKDTRVLCVRGNHEDILEEIINNKEMADIYRRKYGSGYDLCENTLSSEDLSWLLNLPKHLNINLDGCSFYMTHGSLSGINDYLYPDASLERLHDNYSDSKITIFGHTHYQFIHGHNDKFILNPGSIGQPRDIGALASYAVINTTNLVIRFKRVSFDYSTLIKVSKSQDPKLEYLWKIMKR